MLNLSGLEDRKVTNLSGGQRQRVALGRSLAIEPEILLLDEPLSNLDAKVRIQLRSEIKALQNRLGFTAIHVTHDREEAMTMADRIVVMDAGRIAQIGSPKEVFDHPNSPFVASFMGAENTIGLDVRPSGDGVEVAVAQGNSTSWNGAVPVGPVTAYFRDDVASLDDPERPHRRVHHSSRTNYAENVSGRTLQVCGGDRRPSFHCDGRSLSRARSTGWPAPSARIPAPVPHQHHQREKTMHKSLIGGRLRRRPVSTHSASAQTLNVATAGDQNMVDYIKDYLGPMFEKSHPGVKVVAVGTGPGDGGSQKIFEKLDAQKKAGRGFGFRRGGDPPEGRRHDGEGRAASRSTATPFPPASW